VNMNDLSKQPQIIYTGSVKNIFSGKNDETLYFKFTDRYSIFDWGEMPDLIFEKGCALNMMGYAFFKHLENPQTWMDLKFKLMGSHFDSHFLNQLWESEVYKELVVSGLNHHCLGLSNNDYVKLPNLQKTTMMEVKKINVLKPTQSSEGYDYDVYQSRPQGCLLPLEVMFRFGLPTGNSLSKRFLEDTEYLKQYGFTELPDGNKMLNIPLVDFSTKLEKGDRYLTFENARKIAGLSEGEFNELKTLTILVGLCLFTLHKDCGLELWDGKIEWAFGGENQNLKTSNSSNVNRRKFMLVDSIGLDEMRLSFNGAKLSKDFLRNVYKQTKWYEYLEKSKRESQENGFDFKVICKEKYNAVPEKLNSHVLNQVSALYKSYTNSILKVMNFSQVFESHYDLEFYRKSFL